MAITTKKIDRIKNIRLLRFFGSMRVRMTAAYFVLMLATLVLMDAYVLGLLSENLYENKQGDMFAKANIIANTVSEAWDQVPDTGNPWTDNVVASCLAGTNIRGLVTDPSMRVLYDSKQSEDALGRIFVREAIQRALDGEQAERMEQPLNGRKVQCTAVPVKRGSQILGVVYLASSTETIESTISSTRMGLIVFSVIICVLIGMISLFMSYVITSPLQQFIDVAREISKGNFSKRVKVKGHSEIAQMGEALNYMCAELGHLEEKRRKFVSDASHELKTPMATIKLVCDSIVSAPRIDMDMAREFLSDLSEEVDRLTRIVEKLLTLTKMGAGEGEIDPTLEDPVMLLQRIQEKLTPGASSKKITLHLDISSQQIQPVYMDSDKLWEALYNITDNAIKYSKIGTVVTTSVSISGNDLMVRISDHGPGIPDAYKEKIFDRFYRLDDSRARDTGGTGLGLAIAKEAVTAHGGTVSVEDNDGGGSVFVLRIPYKTNVTAADKPELG